MAKILKKRTTGQKNKKAGVKKATRPAKASPSRSKRSKARSRSSSKAEKTPSVGQQSVRPEPRVTALQENTHICECGHDHGQDIPIGPETRGTTSDGDWKGAFTDVVEFLRYLDDINRAIMQTDLPSGEFITLLRDLDETGVAMKRLDVPTVDTLGPEGRSELLRLFLTDVFLTKMILQREIAPLEAFELLKIAELGCKGPFQKSSYPVFSRMFLGFMQTVIAAHLCTGRGAITEPPVDAGDEILPEPALLDSLWSDEDAEVLGFTESDLQDGLWNLISPVDMLRLTSTAVMAYLTWRDPKMGEEHVLEGLATLSPPAFILLGCTRTFWALTEGLVMHRPLLRKVRDDGSGSRGAGFFFVLTQEGQDRLGH